ncbi:MAG: zeta toxin family protein [Azoarcus sp.]|jgi:predicted ABC-type ATPase|nr:zeta toxin family protein [Azoarcus sp.]
MRHTAANNRSTLHLIAGPNGAGKTTLYRLRIAPRHPSAEFVNADELALRQFGHPAWTLEESQTGQRLAEKRRRELMTRHKSLVTESTFSHPSKLDLVREAMAAGYRVNLYHVSVFNVELSVLRVAARVAKGGHPVPEDKIRERYERNQTLIHEAAKLADRAYIFDNSSLAEPYALAVELKQGEVVRTGKDIPQWAQNLYAAELCRFSPALPDSRVRQ